MLGLFNLGRTGNENHVVNASALAASTTANVGFIDFDVFSGVAANPILVGTHHAGPQFVENLESSFVTRQSELPLELDGRYAGRLAGDQVGRPEPHRERCVRTFHDGARSEARVAATFPATKHTWAGGDVSRFISHPAVPANKPITPSCAHKISRTRRLVREDTLKLRQRARKRQIASLKHVENHGCPESVQMLNILPVADGCDNRISTV